MRAQHSAEREAGEVLGPPRGDDGDGDGDGGRDDDGGVDDGGGHTHDVSVPPPVDRRSGGGVGVGYGRVVGGVFALGERVQYRADAFVHGADLITDGEHRFGQCAEREDAGM